MKEPNRSAAKKENFITYGRNNNYAQHCIKCIKTYFTLTVGIHLTHETKLQLEPIKSWEAKDTGMTYVWSSIALNDSTIVILTSSQERYEDYFLLIFNLNFSKVIPLDYLEKTMERNYPVLLKYGLGFGIISGTKELNYYESIDAEREIINLENELSQSQVIPQGAQRRYANPVSDCNLFPVCFEYELYCGDSRHFSLLELDIGQKNGKWKNFSSIENKTFPFHKNEEYAPKIDGLKIMSNEIFALIPGSKITSVNKWGMDYYSLVKISNKGKVLEILIASDNLYLSSKKRGVNGVFTQSEYVILKQVFKSDDWKGKQKLFSLDTKRYYDVQLPRGKSKFDIFQINDDNFWIISLVSKEILLCQPVEIEKRNTNNC